MRQPLPRARQNPARDTDLRHIRARIGRRDLAQAIQVPRRPPAAPPPARGPGLLARSSLTRPETPRKRPHPPGPSREPPPRPAEAGPSPFPTTRSNATSVAPPARGPDPRCRPTPRAVRSRPLPVTPRGAPPRPRPRAVPLSKGHPVVERPGVRFDGGRQGARAAVEGEQRRGGQQVGPGGGAAPGRAGCARGQAPGAPPAIPPPPHLPPCPPPPPAVRRSATTGRPRA